MAKTGFAITDGDRVALARFFSEHMPRDAGDRGTRVAIKRALRIDDAHTRVMRHPQTGQAMVALGLTAADGKFQLIAEADRVPRLHDLTKAQAEFLLSKIKDAAVPDDIEETLFELCEGFRRMSLETYVPPANARPIERVATLTEDPAEAEAGEGDGAL